MNGQLDLERRIDAYFAEGPARAPDHLLGQSLRAATAEQQVRRPWWPRGFDRGTRRDIALLFIGAAAALALGGLVLLRGGLIPLPGPTDSAMPGTTPSPTATPTLRASASPTSPLPTAVSTLPPPTAVPSPREATRVQPGAAGVTFDVSAWRVLTPSGGFSALERAAMASDNPLLDAIGGVPRRAWRGVWLTRPTAWVNISGIAADFDSATREAKASAGEDPRRKGEVQFRPNVTLQSGPATYDFVNAARVFWTTTTTGPDRIDRDVEETIYVIEAPAPSGEGSRPLLRLEAVTLAGGETTPFDIVELVRTIWAPQPLVACEPAWAWEPYCRPEPVVPAPRDRMLP